MSIELEEAKLRHPSTGVLQEVIATNSVRAFNSGIEHGAKLERQRVLQIIEDYRHKPSFGYANLISLIKDEQ